MAAGKRLLQRATFRAGQLAAVRQRRAAQAKIRMRVAAKSRGCAERVRGRGKGVADCFGDMNAKSPVNDTDGAASVVLQSTSDLRLS